MTESTSLPTYKLIESLSLYPGKGQRLKAAETNIVQQSSIEMKDLVLSVQQKVRKI